MEAQVRRGAWHDPTLGKMPFGQWVELWKKGRVVEAATAAKNESHLKNHVLPRWKNIRLDGISHTEVQAWVADMQRRKVGAETVRQCHSLLSSILKSAQKGGRIRTNPCEGIDLPTVGKKPERFLSDVEVKAILAQLEGQDRLMVEFDYETGLRWGEVAGLHVKRLDLTRKVVHVVEVATRSGAVKGHPKSKSSYRTVPVPEKVAKQLKEHIKGKGPDDLVFTADPDGARAAPGSKLMLDYTNWRRRVWVDAVKDSGVKAPLPTFHDLRHSYVSRLIAAGADVLTVKAKAGHESLLTTQRYAHTAPGADDRIRAILEAVDSPVTHEAEDSGTESTSDQAE